MLAENKQDVTNDVIRRVLTRTLRINKPVTEGAVDTVEVSFVFSHCPCSTFRFIAVNMFPSHFCRYVDSDHQRFLNFPLRMSEAFKFVYNPSESRRHQTEG